MMHVVWYGDQGEELPEFLNKRWIKTYREPALLPHSKNRNLALIHLSENPPPSDAIIGFPDDDAFYPAGFWRAMRGVFAAGMDYVVTTQVPFGPVVPMGDATKMGERLTLRRQMWHSSSVTMFFRADVVGKTGLFNEELGLGTPIEGGEDTE